MGKERVRGKGEEGKERERRGEERRGRGEERRRKLTRLRLRWVKVVSLRRTSGNSPKGFP